MTALTVSRTRLEFGVGLAHALPRRAHAETGRAVFLGEAGDFEHIFRGEQRSGFKADLVARTLGAIATILAATAGLDAQERAELHLILRGQCSSNVARA